MSTRHPPARYPKLSMTTRGYWNVPSPLPSAVQTPQSPNSTMSSWPFLVSRARNLGCLSTRHPSATAISTTHQPPSEPGTLNLPGQAVATSIARSSGRRQRRPRCSSRNRHTRPLHPESRQSRASVQSRNDRYPACSYSTSLDLHQQFASSEYPVRLETVPGFLGQTIPALLHSCLGSLTSQNSDHVQRCGRQTASSFHHESIKFGIRIERLTGDSTPRKEAHLSERFLCNYLRILYDSDEASEVWMDFIERIFGVSPDGGNGSLELLYLVSVAAVVMLVSCELYRLRTNRRTRSSGIKRRS